MSDILEAVSMSDILEAVRMSDIWEAVRRGRRAQMVYEHRERMDAIYLETELTLRRTEEFFRLVAPNLRKVVLKPEQTWSEESLRAADEILNRREHAIRLLEETVRKRALHGSHTSEAVTSLHKSVLSVADLKEKLRNDRELAAQASRNFAAVDKLIIADDSVLSSNDMKISGK